MCLFCFLFLFVWVGSPGLFKLFGLFEILVFF